MSRLRATQRNGADAVIKALLTVHLADLASRTGLLKLRLVELATCEDKAKSATAEELVTLCAVISEGLLLYDVDKDAVRTDATNSIRAALIGRDLASIALAASIPGDILERFRAGEEVSLSADDLDVLATVVFNGLLRIERETDELVAVGYVAPTLPDRKSRPLPYPSKPSQHPHISRATTFDPNGMPPVAKGSEAPGMAILKSEPPRAGLARLEAKLKAIPGGR